MRRPVLSSKPLPPEAEPFKFAPEPLSGPSTPELKTVDKAPSFRQAFAKRRCLIPADGFYEWRKAASLHCSQILSSINRVVLDRK